MGFTTADWIVVATFAIGALAALVTAWRTRGGRDDEDEPAAPPPAPVALHPDDRSLIAGVRDAAHGTREAARDLGNRLAEHIDATAEHRRAVEDNTAELRRQRDR